MAKAGKSSVKKKATKKVGAADYELRKAFDELRKAFAGLVGEVSRVDADMKKGVELAKAAKGSVSKLIKDPLVSVPQDLKKQVEALEAKLIKMKVQIADRALFSSLEDVRADVKKLEGSVAEIGETVGDHSDRIQSLEEATTAPAPHASPPAHPSAAAPEKADPRQTTLDDAIAKEKEKEKAVDSDDGADREDDGSGPGAGPVGATA